MATFEWVGEARRLKPDGLYRIVSNKPGVGATTYAIAQKVGATATGILAGHTDQGHSTIEVTRGHKGVDAFVYLNDERGDKAAAAIEFGHKNNRTGKRVEGIAPLRKAAGLA